MKLRGKPAGKQLTWDELKNLPIGEIVRDLEGETGEVEERIWEGEKWRGIAWDDSCFTSLDEKPKSNTGIWRLHL